MNSRLESLNQKIKTVVAKYGNLASFFNDLMTCIASFNIERDRAAADTILRKSLTTMVNTAYDTKYSKLLTRYAFNKYKLQSMKASRIQFTRISEMEAECVENNETVTVNDCGCTCVFFRTMKLPCAHFVLFLSMHNEDPFRPHVCADRWKRENAEFAANNRSQRQRRRDMTSNEKFRAAEQVTKKICEIMAEKSQAEFDQWMQKMKFIRECVENNDLEAVPIAQGIDIEIM